MTRPSLRGPLGSVICDVCGRDNADDLTFCQDCGRRLRAREARVAPPTPPSGMPHVALPALVSPALADTPPATDNRAAARAAGPRHTPSRLRPEAPVFSFTPLGTPRTEPSLPAVHGRPDAGPRPAREGAAAPATGALDSAIQMAPALHGPSLADRINMPAPAVPPSAASDALAASSCPSCAAVNPPGFRFCVTCGAPLPKKRDDAAPAPPSLPTSTSAAGADSRPALETARAPHAARDEVMPAARALQDAALRHGPEPDAAPPRRAHDERAHDGDLQPAGAGGSPSAKQARPPLPPVALPPPRLPPLPAGGGTPDKIVGSPVLDIASSQRAPAPPVECARCHGQCMAGTRFCKYCGAPLDPERPSAERPPHGAERPPHGAERPPHGAERPQPAAAPTLEGARDVVRPRDADAAAAPGPETGSAPPPPSQIPLAPLRASYSVRPPAWVPADTRPTRAPQGKLIVIVEDGTEGKSFPLDGPQVDIGRSEGDILLEDDLYVSPRHARIAAQNGSWVLRDLGSINRIYLRIRKTHPLRDGDLLLLGLEVLQFQTVSDGERGLGHAIQHGTLLFGSPAIHRRARLCQRTVEGVTRDVYHLYRDETVIGRETGDIVFTADPFLSRRHAAIRRNPATGEFTLADLESSNGTYVAIREEVSLVDRDFVRIGQHLFRVDLAR
ncbi:FHA domain-containing protein [Sorangium sp. So ce131]|uniref:FHA domain-containing protein n=1 Tax=Sorangium sp. So ce131 TaxID=3133282 RepID=UPI003F62A21B